MPSTTIIPLRTLRLSYPKENLRLWLKPSLQISTTNNDMLDSTQPSEILNSLKSGCIWLSRGNGCHLNFHLSFNGAPLEEREDVREGLGCMIREADLWNQLSISPSLEIPDSQTDPKNGDIRINISHAQSPQSPTRKLASLSTIPANTKPPEGVPCAGLNSIELSLDFHPIHRSSGKKRQRKKLPESSLKRRKKALSPPPEDSMLLDHADSDEEQTPLLNDLHMQFQNSWLDKDISVWTSNEQVEIPSKHEEEDDTMLLDTNSQLLTPPSSARESIPAVGSQQLAGDVKNHASGKEELAEKLNFTAAAKLVDVGIRTLIGGRQIKATPGISLLKPEQDYTLSELAPSIWNPGYLKAVSQRSLFLPAITQTLSTSLLKNTQSSSLREKLLKLANLKASPLNPNGISETGSEHLNGHKIARAVQARAWTMAQKSLVDPMAARRLHSISILQERLQSSRGNTDLLSEESNAAVLTDWPNLFDDLAEFMGEEFEYLFDDEESFEEDLMRQEDNLSDLDERDTEHLFLEPSEEHDGRQDHVSFEIPEEFWEDLRLEEEGNLGKDDGHDDGLFIPEEFWEDIRLEERGSRVLGVDESDMLI